MKIAHSPNEGGFFVSLSDVLFALMSIFVFLMILIATQIQEKSIPASEVEALSQSAASSQQELADLKTAQSKQISELMASLEATKSQLADFIATQPIDLAFMIDGSASMSEAMEQLKKDVRFIATQMPKFTTRLRIGITVYRDKLEAFDLQEIHQVSEDGGTSLAQLSSFLDKLHVISGPVDTALGMRNGMHMLSLDRGTNTKCAYVVIGDVGPYEMVNIESRDPPEIDEETRLVNEIGEACIATKGLSVIMVLRAAEPKDLNDPLRTYTENFWGQMASGAGADRGSLERSTSSMLGRILISLLEPRKH